MSCVNARATDAMVTALAVGRTEHADSLGIVYAGTEPSAVFRSGTGGDRWVDLASARTC